MTNRTSIYEDVTASIIKALQAGAPPWRQPWSGGGCGLPLRASGEPYQGINTVVLWCVAQDKGYSMPQWFTYRQAVSLGGQVRKGEKAAKVVKYGTLEREGDGADDAKVIPFLKSYAVFNAEQIEWTDAHLAPQATTPRDLGTETDPAIDAVFTAMDIPTETTPKAAAFYSPQRDVVHMPPVQTFHDAPGYYDTLAHEYCHATGHRRRLDRQTAPNRKGYAFEELIAEIGGAMVCASLGIATDRAQNAAYVKSWIEALKADDRVIFRAAAAAQKAANLLLETATANGAGGLTAPASNAIAAE